MKTNLLISFLGSVLLTYSIGLRAQSDQPDLIPPSPEATAFQRVGVEQTNPYTGGADVSIPLYNLKLNELSVPISLKYMGIHGIKVQEIASRVGLGWSLNAGGAVSRTVRGLPDEALNKGYLNTPALPNDIFDSNIVQDYIDIQNGITDGEPDYFNYSAPGISGAFLINKDNSILQVPMTDNIIAFNSTFTEFTITSTSGVIYKFADVEEVRSINLGGDITTLDIIPSTWYLTEMKNANGTEVIHFEYVDELHNSYITTYSEIIRNPGIEFSGQNPVPKYTETRTYQRRLNRIYDQDNIFEVKFVAQGSRCDMKHSNFLQEINVKYKGAPIKKYEFDYSYFTKNGVVPLSDPCSGYQNLQVGLDEGDIEKRLRLDKLTEYGIDGGSTLSNPPYIFVYEESVFLPDRHSFSRDHWGFYNGANNPSLEPVQYLDLHLDNSIFNPGFKMVGDADRKANFSFGKAGLLKKISYPLGGHTTIDYEANRVSDAELESDTELKSSVTQVSFTQTTTSSITINLQERPFARVKATGVGFDVGTNCEFTIKFIDSSGNEVLMALQPDQPTAPIGEAFLAPGTHTVEFYATDNLGNCFPNIQGGVNLQWEDQKVTPQKLVGGSRIKSLSNCDGTDCVTKHFSYVDDQGVSTGNLVTIPQYGVALIYEPENANSSIILNWLRTVHSNYPLLTNAGSHVGYREVTEVLHDATMNGKIVRTFISPKDIPDVELGYFEPTNKYFTGITKLGKKYPRWPLVPTYSIDWLRGLQSTEEVYEYDANSSSYTMKSSKVFEYKGTMVGLQNLDIGGTIALSNIVIEPVAPAVIKGIVVRPSAINTGRYIKNYDIATGRIFPHRVTTKSKEGNREVTMITETDYHADYQVPLYEQTDYSNGVKEKTNYSYNFGASTPNATLIGQTEYNTIHGMYTNQNILVPFLSETVRDDNGTLTPLSTRLQFYKSVGNSYYLDQVKTAKESNPLETVIQYGDYDPKGLPLSYSTQDELVHSFNWSDYHLIHSGVATSVITANQFTNGGITGLHEIKAYQYDSGTGRLVSITDANGKKLQYTYDEMGRLILVHDHNGQVIQKIDYYLKNNN